MPPEPTANTDRRMEEWKIAREVLRQFDDRIHDLRKFGFTAVTTLLTISSVFLPSIGLPPVGTGSVGLPDLAKAAAVAAIMMLVVALRYVERTYQMIQRGAAVRARILERALNLDLTAKITDWYKTGKLRHSDLVYTFFALAAMFLGLAVVSSITYQVLVGLMMLAVVVALLLMRLYLELVGTGDLSVDPSECSSGDTVMITFTNLSEDEPFRPGTLAFHIEDQEGRNMKDFKWPSVSGDLVSAWKKRDELSVRGRRFCVFLEWLAKFKNPHALLDGLKGLGQSARTYRERFVSREFMKDCVSFLAEKQARKAMKKVRTVYPLHPPDQPIVPDFIWLREMGSHVWEWDTSQVDPGTYRIVNYRRGDPDPQAQHPLSTIITVRKPRKAR